MSDRKIQEAIQILAGVKNTDRVYISDARVISVNLSARTCSVILVGGKMENTITARLMSAVDDGVFIIPAVDSNVTVIYSEYVEPLVIQYSEVEKIIFRGGEFGGVIKIDNLTLKLNEMVQHINTELIKIQIAFNSLSVAYVQIPLNPFVKTDYENEQIKHG